MQFIQTQLVKNMELNQEKLIADYANDMRTLYTQLEKCDEQMEIMKIKHSDHVVTVVEKCAHNMKAMRTDTQSHHEKEMSTIQVKYNTMMEATESGHDKERTSMQSYLLVMREKHAKEMETMKANHDREISSMQNCLMTIKVDNDKVIKDMEASQICLQIKLLTMEENHGKEVNAMKIEHSNQMDAITIENITLQIKLQIMEKIQVQKFQHRSEDERNKEMATDHKPPCMLHQDPPYYEEVICSIEKWLIEGDPNKMEIDKNRVDAYMVDPPGHNRSGS